MFVSCHVAQVEVPGPKGSKEIHRNQPINLNFIATFRYNEEEYPLAIVFSRPGASQVWMFDKEADAKNAYLNLLALTTTITARGPHTDEGFGE